MPIAQHGDERSRRRWAVDITLRCPSPWDILETATRTLKAAYWLLRVVLVLYALGAHV